LKYLLNATLSVAATRLNSMANVSLSIKITMTAMEFRQSEQLNSNFVWKPQTIPTQNHQNITTQQPTQCESNEPSTTTLNRFQAEALVKKRQKPLQAARQVLLYKFLQQIRLANVVPIRVQPGAYAWQSPHSIFIIRR
jgi:hypothetical protein